MEGQYVVYELVWRCHLACLVVETIVAETIVEVAAVVDDGAGEMIMLTEEEVVVVAIVEIGRALVALEETGGTQGVEADLHEDDVIEVLEEVEAVLQIIGTNEEKGAFHLEDPLVLDVMERVAVKVAVDLARLNTMDVEEVLIPMEATINSTTVAWR